MKNNVKPTFGATPSHPIVEEVKQESRTEIGAIWEKISKANTKFLNIKLNIPKKTLLEILAKSTTEEVSIGFVAFPNKHQNGDLKRPTFRIFEDQKK